NAVDPSACQPALSSLDDIAARKQQDARKWASNKGKYQARVMSPQSPKRSRIVARSVSEACERRLAHLSPTRQKSRLRCAISQPTKANPNARPSTDATGA